MTEVLRHGARTLLAQAIEAEIAGFLARHAELVDEAGRRRLVRNGFLPEREIQTGIGPVAVRQPRVRDVARRPPTSGSGSPQGPPACSRRCVVDCAMGGVSGQMFSWAVALVPTDS